MPIPDNEFSNDYQEVAEEHNVSASMAQSGLKCKYDRLLVRLKEFNWEEVGSGKDYYVLELGGFFLGAVVIIHNKWVVYLAKNTECNRVVLEDYYNTLKEAKKALEDWFINQIGEEE